MPRREIDPQLPFIQLHRSVVQRAVTLSTILKLPTPHVVGALAIFWLDLSDRRILAKHLERGRMFLERHEVEGRLRLAFGQSVDLEDFVVAGILEKVNCGLPTQCFRVRGMSTQIEAEAKRLRLKSGGSGGTPQPRPGPAPAPHGEGPGPAEVRGERRELKDEEETTAGPSAPAEIEQAFKNVPSERQEPNLRAFSDAFCSEFKAARQGQAYLWQDAKDTQALKRLMKHGLEEFVRRARAGLRTETFGRINTVAQLAAKWNDLAVAVTAPRGNSKQPEAPPLPRYTDEELENLYKPGGLHGFKKPTG